MPGKLPTRFRRVRPAILAISLLLGTGLHAAPKADRILRNGDWELRIEYLQKGTRSEGQRGTLFFQGKEVVGSGTTHEIETTLGALKFYGARPKSLWLPSGWNFKDYGTIPSSMVTNRAPFELENQPPQ